MDLTRVEYGSNPVVPRTKRLGLERHRPWQYRGGHRRCGILATKRYRTRGSLLFFYLFYIIIEKWEFCGVSFALS